MTDVSDMVSNDLITEMVLGSLGARDERLNELAAELLFRRGRQTLPLLFDVATNTKSKPDHRILAMRVIARFGPPYGEEMLDFSVLQRDRNKAVRAAASKMFGFAGMLLGVRGK